MNELKPCPFCGGKARISFKDIRFGGQNCLGDKKIMYRVQIICNKCHSRGKPINTDYLINPNPYCSVYSGRYSGAQLLTPRIKEQTELFRPYVEKAVEAWNERAGDTE